MSTDASLTPAIEVSHLKCGYEGKTVLKDVSFSVRPGEIFFVIGGSGCGKSTLLRNMIGIHTPVAGTVNFFGESFTASNSSRRRQFLKTFGVLYQGGALWTSLTLRQNVASTTPVITAPISRTTASPTRSAT